MTVWPRKRLKSQRDWKSTCCHAWITIKRIFCCYKVSQVFNYCAGCSWQFNKVTQIGVANDMKSKVGRELTRARRWRVIVVGLCVRVCLSMCYHVSTLCYCTCLDAELSKINQWIWSIYDLRCFRLPFWLTNCVCITRCFDNVIVLCNNYVYCHIRA